MKRGGLLPMLLLLQVGYAQNNKNKEDRMLTSEKNKQIVQQVYEQAMNKREFSLLQSLVADEYTGIAGRKGPAAFREPLEALIRSMPDVQWSIQELVAEGDKVFISWKTTGTNKESFNGFAPTNKTAISEGMALMELKNGKVIRTQVLTDRLGFLQQLDVLPVDISALAVNKKDRVLFIDKFQLPASGKQEFYSRVQMNRNFIKKLPGFIEDAAYEYTDEKGMLTVITVAQWKSMDAIEKAKEAVQAEYKRIGFDRAELYKRLQIVSERGVYSVIKE